MRKTWTVMVQRPPSLDMGNVWGWDWLHLPWLGAKGDVIAAQQPLAALFCSHSGAVVLLLWGTNKLSLAYFP